MRSRCRHLLLILALSLGAGVVLSACGQKGPLYLPEAETRADRQEDPEEPETPREAIQEPGKPQ